MSGIFEELEMFDEGDKVVTRQAIAAATKRLNDNFGGFLRQAFTKKEFESRLALVDTDINNMVADVVTEYGGDAEKIASAVKETVKTAFTPTTPAADESCSNCGGHGCEHCSDDPEASKTASEGRPERLEAQDEIQLAEEHSQVNPWLKKQIQDEDQEDGGNLRNKEANLEESQPVANPVPLAKTEGIGGNIEEQLEKAPSAIGTGKIAFEYTIPEGQVEEEPVDPATEQLQAQFENWFNTQPFPDELRTTCLGSFDQAYQLARQNRPDFDQMDPEAQLRALIEEVFRIRVGGPEFEGNFPNTPNNNPVLGKAAGLADVGDWIGEKANDALGAVEEAGRNVRDKTLNAGDWIGEKASDALGAAEDYAGRASDAMHAPKDKFDEWRGASAHTVEKKGDEFVVVEDGGEEAAGPFDSQEEAYARANELNDLENLETEETHKEASVTPAMQKALALKEAAARGEKRNFFSNKPTVCPQCKMETEPVIKEDTMGPEKVCPICNADMTQVQNPYIASKPETGDKTEENESLPTGNEDAHDGPSPKIDKKKWKPNATNPDGNLKPIDTEGENSPHPTRQMDIKQKPDYQNDDPFEHDNNVWEREELPTADDNAGFDGTRNIEQLPTKTFPDKGQTNPVTREALAGNEKVAIFEDERDILEENVPEDYAPSREGIMSELADLKQRLIEGGSSPEEAEAEIKDLVMGMWRTEQSPEELGEIGIEDIRSEFDEPVEEIEIEEGPEEIEEIIERGDDEDDRVEVIHDHKEDEDEDPLGFDDPDKLDEDEDEDIPFDEELSEEELDRLLKEEEEYDDEDLFL